jgi:hypothetical protein
MNNAADRRAIGNRVDAFHRFPLSRLRQAAGGLLILASMHSSAMSVYKITLEDSVCNADLIVVAGSLLNVKEQYMSVRLKRAGAAYSTHLDKGYLDPVRVLKGPSGVTAVGVLFPSKGQDDAFRKILDPHIGIRLHFAGTGEVIWFLHREILDGDYIVRREFPPLPLSDVEATTKLIGAGKCPPSRIPGRALYP